MKIYNATEPNSVTTLKSYLKLHPEIVTEGIWVKCAPSSAWIGEKYVRVLGTRGRVAGGAEQPIIYYKCNVISPEDIQWALDHDYADFPNPKVEYTEFCEFMEDCSSTYERDLGNFVLAEPIDTIRSSEFLPDNTKRREFFSRIAGKDQWVKVLNFYSEQNEYLHVVRKSGDLVEFSAIPEHIITDKYFGADTDELFDYLYLLEDPTHPDGYACIDSFWLFNPIETLSTSEILEAFNEFYPDAVVEFNAPYVEDEDEDNEND